MNEITGWWVTDDLLMLYYGQEVGYMSSRYYFRSLFCIVEFTW